MKANSKKKHLIRFSISPFGYLKRAKRLLRQTDVASLFYAALELRCAIEARAREQLFSSTNLSNKARKLWNADKIMRELEKKIYGAKYGITLNFIVRGSKQKIRPFTYRPIDKNILKAYGKLGNMLHLQRKEISIGFIKSNKKWLNKLCADIQERCLGHMLQPPQWKIRCSKCGQLLGWEEVHKGNGSNIVCTCGHKTSLIGKNVKINITARKRSSRIVELLQANCVEAEI